jgi:hypothetical protein
MKKNTLGFLILVLLLNNCGIFKNSGQTNKTDDINIANNCDSFIMKFYKYPKDYTPIISNIDPEKQVVPVTLGDLYAYQIEFNDIKLFRNYEVWLDDIKFDFDLESNNPNCSQVGDKIICLVDQIKLGKECSDKNYEDTKNGYDCVFMHRWTIKVRGKACDNVFGPFSNELQRVSLQCKF